MNKKHILLSVLLGVGTLCSCSDYLSVDKKLGENTQDLEKIFSDKNYTEQWLANCFTFLTWYNIDIGTKDWCITNFSDDLCYGDRGKEYRTFKYCEYDENWKQDLWYQSYWGIRQASIMLNNLTATSSEIDEAELKDYRAQARFIRAYFYWKLMQKYGPVPIIPTETLDYDDPYEQLELPRNTYDECADFIASEMAQAAQDLPLKRDSRNIARPTRGAALATRAKALLYAASPLNNPRPSDTDRFSDFTDDAGRPLLGQEYNEERWAKAAAAARDVINLGVYQLYTVRPRTVGTEIEPATVVPPYNAKYSDKDYPNGWANIDPQRSYEDIFNGNVTPSNNPEMIFTTGVNGGGNADLNTMVQHQMPVELGGYNCHAMTGKQCDAYEMNDGTPFDKTKEWNGDSSYVTAEEVSSGNWRPLEEGVNKRYAHREPRFYASASYSGSLWVGSSATEAINRNKRVWYYRGTLSGWSGDSERWLPTGVGVKKYVNRRDNFKAGGLRTEKAVVGMRYADVLLWYAEALNELTASHEVASWDGAQTYTVSRDPKEMSYAVSRVRLRAGLPDYDDATYADADKFRVKLKHERQIEFFAENIRYYDLRRWRDAEVEETQQMYGCNPLMSEKEKDLFYTQVINSDLPTTFNRKMYFWPIKHDELRKNSRMTQSPGWTYPQ